MGGLVGARVTGEHDTYLLHAILGEGGFGVVHAGTAEGSGLHVAVKVLRPDTIGRTPLARFHLEVAALRRLDHPGIAPFVDAGVTDGRPFLVLRRLDGESLAERIAREGALPAEQVREMLAVIGAALAHAHAHGVVHRDITPSNIIWSDGRWWLIDFGLALDADDDRDERLTSSGVVVGTSAYMSPEQVAGARHVDHRTDQYSLACVAYEALAGVPPFIGGSPQATRAMRLHMSAPDLLVHRPGTPSGMRSAIARALSREPADRFRSIAEFVRALDSEVTDPSNRSATSPQRHTYLFLLTAAVCAGIAVVLWRWPFTAPAPQFDPRRVAVLFFEDLSPRQDLRWLSRGLTTDLIHDLSGLDTLTVVSLAGVQPYRGSSLPPDSIARALEVGTIVDGSVRRTRGDSLEVTMRLIDAGDRFRVRSVRLARADGEIASLQDDMLFGLSAFLREHVGRSAEALRRRQSAPDPRAWSLVQEATEALDGGLAASREGEVPRAWVQFARADSLLAASVAIDSSWPVPWVMRASVARAQFRSISVVNPVPGQPPGREGEVVLALDRISAGLAFAKRAVALDSTGAEAITLRGYFYFSRWLALGQPAESPDLATARTELERLVRRDDTQALAWVLLSRIHEFGGDVARSNEAAERAYEADPFLNEGRRALSDLIMKDLEGGRSVRASERCAAARAHYLDDSELSECRLIVLGWTANHRDSVGAAWQELRRVEFRRSPQLATSWMMRRMYVAAIAARTGLVDSARSIVHRARIQQGPDHGDSLTVALAEAWIETLARSPERAIELLERFLATSSAQRERVASHPWFITLRDTPRFRALVAVPRRTQAGTTTR